MVKIIKNKSDNLKGIEYHTFLIELSEGKFIIRFAGNFDLYWTYSCSYDEMEELSQKTFRILKKDGYFYQLVSELYESIKNYKIYAGNEFLEIDEEYSSDLKQRLMESDKSNSQRLFSNGIVDWHSDDASYEETSRLLIEPTEAGFNITFIKGVTDMGMSTFSIRICNSGSRYDPFNVCFMHMYHGLIEYNPEFDNYHQIDFEKYLLTRKKEN